jgi:hypothetical protein
MTLDKDFVHLSSGRVVEVDPEVYYELVIRRPETVQEMRYREGVEEGIAVGQEEWMLRYYSLLEDVVSFHLLRISSEEFFSRHPDIPSLDSGRS